MMALRTAARDRFVVEDEGCGVVAAIVIVEVAEIDSTLGEKVLHGGHVGFDFSEVGAFGEEDEKSS